jgi:TetR/AcrR family transcriptional regulator, transcriptional repressor for nem operon
MARPREFNDKKVVNQITQLFWEKGFKGTSMDDLVKTTGLNKGSLYTCFGNKEEIFKLALENYLNNDSSDPIADNSAIGALCRFYALIISDADLPRKKRRGCFVFNSCLEFGNQTGRLASFVRSMAQKREEFFQGIIEEAKAKREIPTHISAKRAGQRAFATAFAIRELSKFKPDRDFLSDIANTFLESIESEKRIDLVKRKMKPCSE